MESQPIDDLNFVRPNRRKNGPVVKVVTIALCVISLVLSILCFRDIFDLIGDYFSYRHKFVVWFALERTFVAISISSIPLSVYLAWQKRFGSEGIKSYLVLLTIAVFLFSVLIIAGIEVIFSFSVTRLTDPNSLYPPIPRICFNLLFMLDALFLFLLFQILSRREKEKIQLKNK